MPFRQITSAYLLLMATAFLLYPGLRGYRAISEAKFGAFLLLSGGYVFVMLLFGVRGLLLGALKLPKPAALWRRASLSRKLAALYALLTWLSALVSAFFPDTVIGVSRYEGALSISLYCVCFLLVSVWGRADKRLLIAFAASAALFGALCCLQLLGKNPLRLFPEGMDFYGAGRDFPGEYIGTIGNTDLVSAYLCAAIPILWIGLLRLKGRLRFLLLIPLALLLATLVRVRVAGSFVGVGLGGLLCLPVVLPAGKRGRLLALALVLAVLLLGAAGLYCKDFGGGTLHELHELLHGRVQDSFGSGRIRIWRAVLEKLPGRWLLGWGPDTMLRAGIEPFTRFDEARGAVITAEIDTAHNEYLNVLFHQGVFALLALLAALAALCVRWVRCARDSAAAAMLGGAVLCWALQAFFGIGTCITAPFFWLPLALLEQETGKSRER